jgi:hypothetical protein
MTRLILPSIYLVAGFIWRQTHAPNKCFSPLFTINTFITENSEIPSSGPRILYTCNVNVQPSSAVNFRPDSVFGRLGSPAVILFSPEDRRFCSTLGPCAIEKIRQFTKTAAPAFASYCISDSHP